MFSVHPTFYIAQICLRIELNLLFPLVILRTQCQWFIFVWIGRVWLVVCRLHDVSITWLQQLYYWQYIVYWILNYHGRIYLSQFIEGHRICKQVEIIFCLIKMRIFILPTNVFRILCGHLVRWIHNNTSAQCSYDLYSLDFIFSFVVSKLILIGNRILSRLLAFALLDS